MKTSKRNKTPKSITKSSNSPVKAKTKTKKKIKRELVKKLKDDFGEAKTTARSLLSHLPSEKYQREADQPEVEAKPKKSKGKKKHSFFCGEHVKREDAVQILENKHNEMKGKKLNYAERLVKKGLKNRIRKKKRQEERKKVLGVKNGRVEKPNQNLGLKNSETKAKAVKNGIQKKKLKKMELEIETDSKENVDDSPVFEEVVNKSTKSKKVKNKKNVEKVNIVKEEVSNKNIKPQEITQEISENSDLKDTGTEDVISKKQKKRVMKLALKQQKKKEKKAKLRAQKKAKDESDGSERKAKDNSPQPMKKTKEEEIQPDVSAMTFNKFDFTGSDPSVSVKPITDPKRALQVLEKNKAKIERLKSTGREEKADKIKVKQTWTNAILRAEGVKVKDDPELLKKSIRKKENKKNRSKKNWQKREDQVKQKMDDSQKKRKENIMKKNKEKKGKKLKRAIKKGRVVL